jgi:hypothetical protein
MTPPPPRDDLWLASARKLTHTLDKRHLDPLLGFFCPVVGDVAGGLLGLYLLILAWRAHKPRVVLARMALNTAIDTGIGAIPLVGDVFDYFFRANSRNLALLERPAARDRHVAWDGVLLGLSLVALVAALCLPLVLLGWLVAWALGFR